jgi:GT2 family glycosyltransferase
VEFVKSEVNLGFSGGCNVGIRKALNDGYDYTLLLNNDTLVTKGFLSSLCAVARSSEEIGVVGGKTLFEDDRKTIWDACGYITEKSYRGVRRRDGHPNIDKQGEVGFVTCCLALVKKEVYDKIGLLPEAYFFGSEEWEFSLRASRAGFKLVYTPRCTIYHKVGRSHDHTSSKMLYNTYRNRILFVKRNYGKTKYLLFLNGFLFLKLSQRLLNKGQLRDFSFKKSLFLLSEVLKDSKKYDSVTKQHWKKFE